MTQVSERWLQTYANGKYEAVPQKAVVTPKKKAVLQSSVMKCGICRK